MKGRQRAIALPRGFMSGQGLQLFAITAIADPGCEIYLIPFSTKDLSYMGTRSTYTGSCCFNLEETQEAR